MVDEGDRSADALQVKITNAVLASLANVVTPLQRYTMKVHLLDLTFRCVFEAPLFFDKLDGIHVDAQLEDNKPYHMWKPIPFRSDGCFRRSAESGSGAVAKAIAESINALAIDSDVATGRSGSWLNLSRSQNLQGPFQRGRVVSGFDIHSASLENRQGLMQPRYAYARRPIQTT